MLKFYAIYFSIKPLINKYINILKTAIIDLKQFFRQKMFTNTVMNPIDGDTEVQ